MTPSLTLLEGITVEALAVRIADGLALEPLLGDTAVLVFRPRLEESASPIYVTPADGGGVREDRPADTSVFDRSAARAAQDELRAAVVVPLTVSNRNLLEDQVLIGRAHSNDVRLISPQVSKVHVHVQRDDERWEVVDHGSLNGTTLNGLKLEPGRPYRLHPSDELALGDVTAVFLDAEGLSELCSLL